MSSSPTLIAEYQTRLPDRKLLQAKLHEFYELTESATLPKPEYPVTVTTSSQTNHADARPPRKSRKDG